MSAILLTFLLTFQNGSQNLAEAPKLYDTIERCEAAAYVFTNRIMREYPEVALVNHNCRELTTL